MRRDEFRIKIRFKKCVYLKADFEVIFNHFKMSPRRLLDISNVSQREFKNINNFDLLGIRNTNRLDILTKNIKSGKTGKKNKNLQRKNVPCIAPEDKKSKG